MAVLAACAVAGVSLSAGRVQDDDEKKEKVKRASLSLKVNPPISFSPARVVVTAELKGGAEDDADLYCPRLEWDWGDGTRSEATVDCEPFEAGRSTIQRRWSQSHTFNTSGNYRIQLRLKRGDRSVLAGTTTVQVRPGIRDVNNGF